jgi:hypothetical protein
MQRPAAARTRHEQQQTTKQYNGGSFFSGQTPGLHLRQAPPNQTGRRPGEARETPGPPACNSRLNREEATTSPTAYLHSDGGPVQIPTNFSQCSRNRTFSLLIPPSSPIPFRAAKHSRKSSTTQCHKKAQHRKEKSSTREPLHCGSNQHVHVFIITSSHGAATKCFACMYCAARLARQGHARNELT